MTHDNSKFFGVEWEYLNEESKQSDSILFQQSLMQHRHTNKHHPEYWGGIDLMPRIYIAEMVCDWKARSDEFGTDLRTWIKETASEKWKFTLQGRVYKDIKEFVDLLLDPKFN